MLSFFFFPKCSTKLVKLPNCPLVSQQTTARVSHCVTDFALLLCWWDDAYLSTLISPEDQMLSFLFFSPPFFLAPMAKGHLVLEDENKLHLTTQAAAACVRRCSAPHLETSSGTGERIFLLTRPYMTREITATEPLPARTRKHKRLFCVLF